jgi:hypothetical protein
MSIRLRIHSSIRGSTLVIVMVLLAVLAVIGVAAVSLGAQERANASAKGTRDSLFACAAAARLQLWAELAKYGRGYLDSSNPPSEILLPDGTRLAAPAHYSKDMPGTVTVSDLVLKNTVQTATTQTAFDLTNTFTFMQGLRSATSYSVLARCRDARGRELEVEFVTSLVL